MGTSIIRLTEEPQDLSFRHRASDATEATSQYGKQPEYRYDVAPGGILYLPEQAHKLLCELNPPIGTPVACRKYKDRGRWQYSFGTHDDYSHAHGRSYKTSGANALAQAPEPWDPEPWMQPASTQSQRPQLQRTNTAPVVKQIAAAAGMLDMSAAINRPAAKLALSALYAAIEAMAVAQGYAERKGLDCKFTGEDVRALAITVYINAKAS